MSKGDNMSDFKVKVSFKNKELETVVEKEYDFIDYTMLINLDLKRILKNIEDAFSYFNNGKPKEEWSKEVSEMFGAIRHKILDQANAIRRLPENLSYKDVPANTINFSEYLAKILR